MGTGILRVSPVLGTWQPWHSLGRGGDTYGEVAASGVPKLSVMSPRGGGIPKNNVTTPRDPWKVLAAVERMAGPQREVTIPVGMSPAETNTLLLFSPPHHFQGCCTTSSCRRWISRCCGTTRGHWEYWFSKTPGGG